MADDLLDALLSNSVDEAHPEFEKENQVLAPLLNEINLIKDQGVRSLVRAVLFKTSKFWDMPGGKEHHPPDERGPGGNIIHTQRVVRICNILIDSFSAIEVERDVLIAAAILHDVTKYVDWAGNGEFKYDRMHPYTVTLLVEDIRKEEEKYSSLSPRSFVRDCDPDIVETILQIVRRHLGPWSPVPETYPYSMADWALHLSDHIASKLHEITDSEIQEWRWNCDAR